MLTDKEIDKLITKFFRESVAEKKYWGEDSDAELFRFSKYILKYCEEKVMQRIEEENNRILNNMIRK